MLMKSYQVVFFTSLVVGTLIACSANSWFTCWLGLEINLMSLIPLLIIKLNPLSTESAIKYFLVQAMASLILIFCSLMDMSVLLSSVTSFKNEIILMALLTKAGVAPFHFWFPQVMKISNWAQCLIIITWQKIAPFVLMVSCSSPLIATFSILAASIIGSLGGLNQTNLKTMITYSSITHSGWMLAICVGASVSSWATYFSIYSIIAISIIIFLAVANITFTHQIFSSSLGKINKMGGLVNILSLGGLPPFLGFLAKISAINFILPKTNLFILSILIFASLISLFYYTRMTYSILLSTNKTLMIYFLTTKAPHSTFLSLSLLGNLVAPALVLLI